MMQRGPQRAGHHHRHLQHHQQPRSRHCNLYGINEFFLRMVSSDPGQHCQGMSFSKTCFSLNQVTGFLLSLPVFVLFSGIPVLDIASSVLKSTNTRSLIFAFTEEAFIPRLAHITYFAEDFPANHSPGSSHAKSSQQILSAILLLTYVY